MQFSGNSTLEGWFSAKKVTNQTFWIDNNQRNSLIAYQMRALDVATFGYDENLRENNGRRFKY